MVMAADMHEIITRLGHSDQILQGILQLSSTDILHKGLYLGTQERINTCTRSYNIFCDLASVKFLE